ncbi:MAG: hypothetical protein HYZ54_03345, partial [Ignavibacteriae bacterium]|nr:hypothetical protein [Ignavibacteriota bacterium]
MQQNKSGCVIAPVFTSNLMEYCTKLKPENYSHILAGLLMKVVMALLFAGIIFNATTLSAQTTGAQISYSLNDCLRIATSQNYDVQVSKARLR